MKIKATQSKRYPITATPDRSEKTLRIPKQRAFNSEYIQHHGCSLVAECIGLQWLGIWKPMTALQSWHKRNTPDQYHPKVTVQAVSEGIREISGRTDREVIYYKRVTLERLQRSIKRGHLVIVELGDPIHTVAIIPDDGDEAWMASHGVVKRVSIKNVARKATANPKYRGMVIVKDLREV